MDERETELFYIYIDLSFCERSSNNIERCYGKSFSSLEKSEYTKWNVHLKSQTIGTGWNCSRGKNTFYYSIYWFRATAFCLIHTVYVRRLASGAGFSQVLMQRLGSSLFLRASDHRRKHTSCVTQSIISQARLQHATLRFQCDTAERVGLRPFPLPSPSSRSFPVCMIELRGIFVIRKAFSAAR